LSAYDYGLWPSVVFNVAFFGAFLLSFLRPRKKVEWRSMGLVGAFILALFAEMYGFPLTIFVVTSVLGGQLGVADPFAHINGHLWGTLMGFSEGGKLIICQLGNLLMIGGLVILGRGWFLIHRAQGSLVTHGLYRWVRHPQYTGLFLLTVGMLIQWPTVVTLLMWPILVWTYYRLARREEEELILLFRERYEDYRRVTPAFWPAFSKRKKELLS